jgi:3-oxoacyl-[acyl-carrier-protein] synthase II
MEEQCGVVVAGVGAVTAMGIGASRLWDGVRSGRVAIGPVKNLSMRGYRTTFGGEVTEPSIPEYDYAASSAGREPALDFALVAAEEAITSSGLGAAVRPQRWGVVYGSCNGGLVSGERVLRASRSGREPDWRLGLLVPPQSTAEALSAAFDLRGPVLSVNTACASSAHAMAHAVELLRTGQADVLLVGGSDSFAGMTFAGFSSLESLAAGPATPYAKDRDGLSLGEGAGMLVLARAEVADEAGVGSLADVLGYGLSADGYHPTAPHPEGAGAARAITAALRFAHVEPDAVGYVNGHGTGTAKNDPAEVNAIRAVFRAAADRIALSSTKSMIGHLLGAAGAVESIVTVLALRDQMAPPTAGFTGPDPRCDIDVVPNVARPIRTEVMASNSFAFAGANACVVFGHASRRGGSTQPAVRDERVVVTGLAALSPAGATVADLVSAYRSGVAAGGPRVATVDVDLEDCVPARRRRRMDKLGVLAVAASRTALADAGLSETDEPMSTIGVVLGTGLGPLESLERFTAPLLARGPAEANPAVFPNTVYNAAAGQVAMILGTTGVTSTVTSLHAAGAAAVGVATDLLRTGAADAIVCPAVDVPTPLAAEIYRRSPLCRGRHHTLAEGGYALVLERYSAAKARGARILAEVAGHATASDAIGAGRWDPRGRGLERAMRAALAAAEVDVTDLTAVWTGVAGLPAADRPELRAVRRVLDGHEVRIERPRERLGDPVGAGAHLSAVLAIAGWSSGTGGPVLLNSSSLGGTHVALVLTPWKESE